MLSLLCVCLLGILLPLSHLCASQSTGSHSAPIIPSLDQTFSISVYLVHQNHRHPASPTEQTSCEAYFCFVFTWFYLAKYLTNKQTNVFTEEQIPQTCSLDCNNKKLITIYIPKDKKERSELHSVKHMSSTWTKEHTINARKMTRAWKGLTRQHRAH